MIDNPKLISEISWFSELYIRKYNGQQSKAAHMQIKIQPNMQ